MKEFNHPTMMMFKHLVIFLINIKRVMILKFKIKIMILMILIDKVKNLLTKQKQIKIKLINEMKSNRIH